MKLLTAIVVGTLLLIFLIPTIYGVYVEATTLKEKPVLSFKSSGNCRIVNIAYALNKGYALYLINKKGNTTLNHHIVAVDNNGVIYDFSKGTNVSKGEKIEDYLSRTKTYSYGIIYTDTRTNIDKTNSFSDYILFLVDRSYFYLFRSFYKSNK